MIVFCMEILQRDSLVRGGFAGLKEYRMVMDSRVFGGSSDPNTWNGIGNFVYLADARFVPHGETGLHPHKEIDVISVMVEGRIAHEGSLEHGQELNAFDVQVQRAGAEGFSHNEVNPDDKENRMIQLWVLPEELGECSAYHHYPIKSNSTTRVYGGGSQVKTFDSKTTMDVGRLESGSKTKFSGPTIFYLVAGSGSVNGTKVTEGNLVRDDGIHFEAQSDSLIIAIQNNI